MIIDFALLFSLLPAFAKGLSVSLSIATLSCCIGVFVGVPFGVITAYKSLLRYPVALYVLVIRGTPMLIQIFFALYCLPTLGIHFAPFWLAVCAIGLNSAAYVSQIIRSGIQAVNRGMLEAAQALGFSWWQTIWYFVLPHAIRITFPAIGNEFINLIKDSSLASTIGVMELTRTGQLKMAGSYDLITIWAGVGACYLIVTSLLSFVLYIFEKRINAHVENK